MFIKQNILERNFLVDKYFVSEESVQSFRCKYLCICICTICMLCLQQLLNFKHFINNQLHKFLFYSIHKAKCMYIFFNITIFYKSLVINFCNFMTSTKTCHISSVQSHYVDCILLQTKDMILYDFSSQCMHALNVFIFSIFDQTTVPSWSYCSELLTNWVCDVLFDK